MGGPELGGTALSWLPLSAFRGNQASPTPSEESGPSDTGVVKRSLQTEPGAAGPGVRLAPLRGPLSTRQGLPGAISLTHLGSVGSKGLLRAEVMMAEGSRTTPLSQAQAPGLRSCRVKGAQLTGDGREPRPKPRLKFRTLVPLLGSG